MKAEMASIELALLLYIEAGSTMVRILPLRKLMLSLAVGPPDTFPPAFQLCFRSEQMDCLMLVECGEAMGPDEVHVVFVVFSSCTASPKTSCEPQGLSGCASSGTGQ